jgi:hypothetical protein
MLVPLLLLIAQAQPAAATCDADGVVVNSITGQPIPRARIVLMAQQGAVSDNVGHWQASGLPCGRASILATKPGFLGAGVNKPVTLPAHDIRVELVPQSVIVGRVLDDQGDPVFNAQLTVFTSRVVMGKRTPAQSGGATTNDLGEFRIAGLAAGKIVICARAPVEFQVFDVLGESCYPGPIDAGMAGALSLPAGREARVDFSLSRVPSARVKGKVVGIPDGASLSVSLSTRNNVRGGNMNRGAAMLKDGSFEIRAVPPGAYTLSVDYWEAGKRLMARTPVDVNGADLEGVVVHLESGVSVTGTIRIESQSGAAPKPQQINVNLQSTDPMLGGGAPQWNKDRTGFTMGEVIPGTYTMNVNVPAPFYLRSAMLGGRDISKEPITIAQATGPVDVLIADDSGTIQGQVEDADGQPVNAMVTIFREGNPPRIVNVSPDGHYKAAGLAPGDYKIYAWDDFQQVAYAEPDWMQRNGSNGVSVTVSASQTTEQKLIRAQVPKD